MAPSPATGPRPAGRRPCPVGSPPRVAAARGAAAARGPELGGDQRGSGSLRGPHHNATGRRCSAVSVTSGSTTSARPRPAGPAQPGLPVDLDPQVRAQGRDLLHDVGGRHLQLDLDGRAHQHRRGQRAHVDVAAHEDQPVADQPAPPHVAGDHPDVVELADGKPHRVRPRVEGLHPQGELGAGHGEPAADQAGGRPYAGGRRWPRPAGTSRRGGPSAPAVRAVPATVPPPARPRVPPRRPREQYVRAHRPGWNGCTARDPYPGSGFPSVRSECSTRGSSPCPRIAVRAPPGRWRPRRPVPTRPRRRFRAGPGARDPR